MRRMMSAIRIVKRLHNQQGKSHVRRKFLRTRFLFHFPFNKLTESKPQLHYLQFHRQSLTLVLSWNNFKLTKSCKNYKKKFFLLNHCIVNCWLAYLVFPTDKDNIIPKIIITQPSRSEIKILMWLCYYLLPSLKNPFTSYQMSQ